MAAPSSTLIFGSTGLTGSQILSTLLATLPPKPITTISRRQPAGSSSPNLTTVLEADSTKWAPAVASVTPKPDTVISALGTTRAQAGGLANQWKIDHDLNIEIAKAAKDAGAKTFVFVSSAGTRGLLKSLAPYSKMKIGVEDAIRDLGFEQAIILRPGALLGEREQHRAAESILQTVMRNLDSVGLKDKMAVEGEVVGRAVAAALKTAGEGKAPEKYWILENTDIVKLGRDTWKAESAAAAQ
ncbi:hypothetical protein NLU13_9530 [Sarocladium strictum]|uniref:NAD-dependent epimerase/dehydratase domain-containing protein n=1 Tax=Sarocladium strictum TaxID=5046 RepID=A0AA39GBP5_SARSR|nr:hypothetical protein NLU13_9530 [Sarocladium strictum]